MRKRLFTSESVTEGHPDKICDKVADAVLDAILDQDPLARVACEALATTGLVMVAGEITTVCYVDIEKTVRQAVRDIGYDSNEAGFSSDSCAVITSLKGQSPDIARGVDTAFEVRYGGEDDAFTLGAGDQGMMFGYACDETDDFMPLPIYLAHRLAKRLAYVRKEGKLKYLLPDGKSQVTVEYEGDAPIRVANVVLAAQHLPDVKHSDISTDLMEQVINPIIPEHLRDSSTKYYINATGRFVVGGPMGDCGLTGRKIIVDTYGGYARHGGGSFSGKDPTKVDRSGAYMARYIAKNIVASGAASRCEVQLAYAIGVAEPMCVNIDTFGTGNVADNELTDIVCSNIDLRPMSIIKSLNLRRPIYQQTAAYGHFGRMDLDLPWEKTDKVHIFK